MNTKLATSLASLAIGALCITSNAHSAVLLSTGFDGTTLDGTTDMTGITYTTALGLTGPTSLNSDSYSVFNTANATGHFAPNVNVGTGNPWTLVFTMVVGANDLQIDEVVWDRQQFTSTGVFNTSTGKIYAMDVNLTGSVSGNYGTVTVPGAINQSLVDQTSEFAFNNVAMAGETLTMTLTVNASTGGGGVYIGMDGFTVNGSVIPEPSVAILGSLGLLALLRRRR